MHRGRGSIVPRWVGGLSIPSWATQGNQGSSFPALEKLAVRPCWGVRWGERKEVPPCSTLGFTPGVTMLPVQQPWPGRKLYPHTVGLTLEEMCTETCPGYSQAAVLLCTYLATHPTVSVQAGLSCMQIHSRICNRNRRRPR